MKYVLSGDPKTVERVLQENRIRVNRGEIAFTPVHEACEDDKDVFLTDTKDVPDTDTKAPKKNKKK